jgi:ribosome recycling factor
VLVASSGATMPLNQLATVQAPDARLLTITPWDKSTISDIERGIIAAGLGLNPSNDGQLIRVPVPPLTQDRRRDLVKQVKQAAEAAKIRVRQVRKEYNDIMRQGEKDGDVSEDQLHRLLAKVQESTDAFVKKVDEVADAKEAEILEV